jgi:hypothetical protein
VSSTEGTVDKVELCERALARLGTPIEDALLVDNVRAHVDAFRAAGGHGYHFTDETTFARDLADGRLPVLA